MATWFLVLYVYAGAFASGDSVNMLVIPQPYVSEASCKAEGAKHEKLVKGSAKEYSFTCVKAGY